MTQPIGSSALDPFQQRILDLQTVDVGGTPAALERAAERLGQDL